MRLNPNDGNIYINKGNALYHLGKPKEAIILYDQALRLNPINANAYTNKGVALNNLGNPNEAIKMYDRALRINPNDSEIYNNKGNALDHLGKPNEAIIMYDQALRINPNYGEAQLNRGLKYYLYKRKSNEKIETAQQPMGDGRECLIKSSYVLGQEYQYNKALIGNIQQTL